MAIPIDVTLKFKDGEGHCKTGHFYLPSGTSAADIQTITTAVAGKLNALNNAKVVESWYRTDLTVPTPGTPTGRVEAGATMSFKNVNNKGSFSLYLPGIDGTHLEDEVLITDTEVDELVAMILEGTGYAPSVQMVDANGLAITSYTGGAQSVSQSYNKC